MRAVLIKEFHDFLDSLIAYVVIGVFLLLVGLVMWILPETNVLDYGYANMEPVFLLGPYILIFLVPAITMKSFAEEKRSGTIELLFTLPLKIRDIVVGKFLASWALVGFALAPTVLFYFSLHYLGNPSGNLDSSGIVGSYIGLMLLGGIFVSIGLLASILTQNQILSFILAAVMCYFLFEGLTAIAALDLTSGWELFFSQASIGFHYHSMGRGLITLSDIVYMIGSTVILLSACHLCLQWNR